MNCIPLDPLPYSVLFQSLLSCCSLARDTFPCARYLEEQTGSLTLCNQVTQIASMDWIPVVLDILSARRIW